jgi:hypothetical protein
MEMRGFMGFNTNFANMHLHSTHSDGQFSPFHLAVLAKSLGYGGVVLSDHDVISGVPELMRVAKMQGLETMSGVEISCEQWGTNFHILGYDFDINNPELVAFIDRLCEYRNSHTRILFEAALERGSIKGITWQEVVELKATDINSKDMTIFVEDGKGGKDRYTVLSHKALETLKSYYQLNGYLKKCKWLFPGSDINKPISTRSIQKKFSDLKKSLSLNPKSTVHSIRHGFATHMLEAGVDVYHLQKLMGHSSVQTTTIYIHISSVKAVNVISPHDTLPEY